MNALIDSNVFIGAWHKGDQYAEKAVTIFRLFADQKIQTLYTTNYVLIEIVNFLLRKADFEIAREAYDYVITTDRLKVIYIDKFLGDLAYELFVKNKQLSITDCSLIILGQQKGINKLFSFDSGFDTVHWIERLEN